MSRKPQQPRQNTPRLPNKWLAGLLVVLLAYAVLQPIINRQLGWSLPSLSSLAEQAGGRDPASPTGTQRDAAHPTHDDSDGIHLGQAADDTALFPRDFDESTEADGKPASDKARSPGLAADDSRTAKPADRNENSARGPPSSSLKFGYLKEIGPDDFLSPAGLRYTRGSEEGHRLKHLAKHLTDEPDRPGSHGVFDGDMPSVLRLLDDAYERAQQGKTGTSKRQERERWVLEVKFDKPVGYVGGSTGKRRGYPSANRVRLVLEDTRVITAFPY